MRSNPIRVALAFVIAFFVAFGPLGILSAGLVPTRLDGGWWTGPALELTASLQLFMHALLLGAISGWLVRTDQKAAWAMAIAALSLLPTIVTFFYVHPRFWPYLTMVLTPLIGALTFLAASAWRQRRAAPLPA